jgi:hypothetical protein
VDQVAETVLDLLGDHVEALLQRSRHARIEREQQHVPGLA